MGSISPSNKELLENALDDARQLYTKRNAISKENYEEACLYMPGGNTRTVLHTSPFPFTTVSAHSCYINTADGHQYIDFLGEFTAGIYGHNHPLIRQAVEEALDAGWNYGGKNKPEQELAKIVCTRFPSIEKLRFVNSGTEANMMAIATALVATGKKKVLVFVGGYHGSTISGRTPSGKPSINLPHDFVVASFNDVQGTKDLVNSLPQNSLAAILVEPMMGSGGCYIGSKEFLSSLRDLANQQKALLIFDEVMTSRLSYNGFHTMYGLKPDMMTLGKYIGGGMTFGAFGGRDDIMSLYDPRTNQLEHPGTFNNNVFTMRAGIAGCNLLTHSRLAALNDLGNSMRLKVDAVLEKHDLLSGGTLPTAPVLDQNMHQSDHPQRPPKMFIKGVGSLMCIHFAGPDKELLQGLFFHHMLEQGIYAGQKGFIALSIEIADDHIDKFVQAVDSFCRQWDSVLRWDL